MRDINRIDRIIPLLRTVWKINPDIRLGQLISNITDNEVRDIFYLDDKDLETNLLAILKGRKQLTSDGKKK